MVILGKWEGVGMGLEEKGFQKCKKMSLANVSDAMIKPESRSDSRYQPP